MFAMISRCRMSTKVGGNLGAYEDALHIQSRDKWSTSCGLRDKETMSGITYARWNLWVSAESKYGD